jgi:hypothetical protein
MKNHAIKTVPGYPAIHASGLISMDLFPHQKYRKKTAVPAGIN